MLPNVVRLALVAALLAAAGCGQKGPLYLPGDPSAVRQPVPDTNATTVPADEDEEQNDDGER